MKTIPNKWLQDLRRANNHNLAIVEELQSVLKPIEEADENDQDNSSRLKQKPRFDRSKTIEKKEEVTTLLRKTVTRMTRKTVPTTNTGITTTRVTGRNTNETLPT